MVAATFDTLKFAKRLEEAGVPRAQATAEAEVLRETMDACDQALAAVQAQVQTLITDARRDAEHATSKIDLRQLGANTDSELALLRKEMKSEFALVRKDIDLVGKDMEALEQRMQSRFTLLQWMLGFVLGGMLSLVIKAFL